MIKRLWREAVHTVLRRITKLLLGIRYNIRVEGMDNIPATGRIIVVSNHPSWVDSYALPAYLGKNLIFLSKIEYFQIKGFGGWLLKRLLTNRAIPVDRDSPIDGLNAIELMTQAIRDGHDTGGHPEGTRSPPGCVCKGKAGMMQAAWDTGAVFVPVGVKGSYGAKFRSRITLVIGEPMLFEEPKLFGRIARVRTQQAQMRTVMTRIAQLADLPYVDQYAAVIKKKLVEELSKDE